MKKTIIFAFCIILMLVSPFSVCAASVRPEDKFYIEELGITLHAYMYNAVSKNHTNFDISDEDNEKVIKQMEESQIYLWCYSALNSEEIYVYGWDNQLKSISMYNEDGLEELRNVIKQDYESTGAIVTKSEIYESYDTTYIVTHYSNEDNYFAISYYTIENNKSIEVIMFNYGSEPTASQRKNLIGLINSIEYSEKATSGSTTPSELSDFITYYENTFTLSIAENGKLTPLGESLILTAVVILIQIIAGVIVLIILLNKRKKRRQEALIKSDTTHVKFCIYCGVQLTSNDNICSKCGKSQTLSATSTTEADESKPYV